MPLLVLVTVIPVATISHFKSQDFSVAFKTLYVKLTKASTQFTITNFMDPTIDQQIKLATEQMEYSLVVRMYWISVLWSVWLGFTMLFVVVCALYFAYRLIADACLITVLCSISCDLLSSSQSLDAKIGISTKSWNDKIKTIDFSSSNMEEFNCCYSLDDGSRNFGTDL